MSKIRVDYSDLVNAIQKGKNARASELLAEVIPRLQDYLIVVLKASPDEASECVQQAFLDVFEQIRKGNISNSKFIFSYLIKACKHEYYRYVKRQHRFDYSSTLNEFIEPEEQLENLMDKERQEILEKCLAELTEDAREFISYFIDKPDATTDDAIKKFDLTSANVRTKKSRILGRLHHCYKRKSSE